MTKKPLLLILSSLALTLGGCGSTPESSSSPSESSSNPSPTSSSSESTPASSSNDPEPAPSSSDPEPAPSSSDDDNALTIAELDPYFPSDGSKSAEKYRIRATVKTVSNPTTGIMEVYDETGTLDIYKSFGADGTTKYGDLSADEKPVAGDTVLLEGQIQLYKGTTKEMVSASILECVHNEPYIDLNDYESVSIKEARDAEEGTKVHLAEVTVAAITYDSKMNPSGALITDKESSIYVYGADLAGQVSKGDKIELVGEKTSYILEKEKSYAAKYGYAGAIQIQSPTIIKKEAGTLDLSYAQEESIKEIMDIPVTDNVSALIYKTTAYITKTEVTGSGGYVNYYFNDLDGVTGTYAYTQADGEDYEWIDAYVGKIRTVYLSPLNAKSTAYGCNWRFLPVAIGDEDYVFDKNDAAEFAIDYYAYDQFEEEYVVDPDLEVVTSVSNELLGLEGIEISYSSSDEEVASFEVKDGKTRFHLNKDGTANITITASLAGYESAVKAFNATRKSPDDVTALTVAEAQKAEHDSEVTVRGVIGPSLTVQYGFYLIDESGIIPVVTYDSDLWFKTIKMGQQIVLKGTRDLWTGSNATYGTECITDAKLIYNEYGEHEYSGVSFESSTIAELSSKSVQDSDETLKAYTVSAVVSKGSGSYPTYSLVDGSDSLTAYSSSASQYSFLDPYIGKNVTAEIALCNWNSKSSFKIAVLSVMGEDGVKVYNTLHFQS